MFTVKINKNKRSCEVISREDELVDRADDGDEDDDDECCFQSSQFQESQKKSVRF